MRVHEINGQAIAVKFGFEQKPHLHNDVTSIFIINKLAKVKTQKTANSYGPKLIHNIPIKERKKTGCSFTEVKGKMFCRALNLPIPQKAMEKPVRKTVKGKMSEQCFD